jgi:hypothetical protein
MFLLVFALNFVSGWSWPSLVGIYLGFQAQLVTTHQCLF